MDVGIVGYGVYLPRYRITVDEIAKIWGQSPDAIKRGLLIEEKAVADEDEDTITMAVESGRSAVVRAGIDAGRIGALFVGSESHPYAVKPSGTVVAEALGATPEVMTADFEFACKAGTAAMQVCSSFVRSGDIEYGMAMGADTAQGRPGDALEYTAASGAAAFLIGRDPVAVIEATCSYTTDTPDFWRREGEHYPMHGGRFTREPAYFHHLISASKNLMRKVGAEPADFDHVAFHTPNGKFPLNAGKSLGFTKDQLKHNLLVQYVGNTYSGASMIVLACILDSARPGDRILMTSYGSGSGSDSFAIRVTDRIEKTRSRAPSVESYLGRKSYVDYGTYAKLRNKIKR